MATEQKSAQFFDKFLFPKIFQTFRMAIQPSKLIIAFLAVAIICLAGLVIDLSSPTVVVTRDVQGNITETELQVYIIDPEQVPSYIEDHGENGERTGLFFTMWHFAASRFQGAVDCLLALNPPGAVANITEYFRAVRWALRYHLVYSVIFALIKLAVIALAGGAICRIAALQFARDEKPGLTEAIRYSVKKFTSFFTAPLAPAAIIIFIGVFIFLLGLVGNIPRAGELIMGIFMLLALIAAALITVVLIGTVAGFNLMFPAVAYDGSDCFDAISRSFSYVYSKPWRMGFYTAIAAVYGAICFMFVRFFVFLLFWVTHSFLQLGVLADNKLTTIWGGPQFRDLVALPDWGAFNWSQSIAAFLIYLCLLVVVGLVISFIVSFYFSANTIIYSLMRNRVDNTALDDVYTDFEEAKEQAKTEPAATEESEAEETPTEEAPSEAETPPDSSSSEQ